MRKQWKGFISGVMVTLLIAGLVGTAAATIGQKTVSLDYNNIKVTLDGNPVSLVDVNGSTVEPFAINGTTYLPVRAVADALGLAVDWDGNTNTVVLSDGQNSDTLNILKLLDLCVTTKGCINTQRNLNQSVSNYISLSFSASSAREMQDLKNAIGDLTKELPSCLATIFLIQNESESLKNKLEGTPFYYYCDGLILAAESMMEAYEYQMEAFKSAQSYCEYAAQSDFDLYITNINSSSISLESAEYTYGSVYNGVYSETVKALG